MLVNLYYANCGPGTPHPVSEFFLEDVEGLASPPDLLAEGCCAVYQGKPPTVTGVSRSSRRSNALVKQAAPVRVAQSTDYAQNTLFARPDGFKPPPLRSYPLIRSYHSLNAALLCLHYTSKSVQSSSLASPSN